MNQYKIYNLAGQLYGSIQPEIQSLAAGQVPGSGPSFPIFPISILPTAPPLCFRCFNIILTRQLNQK